MVDRAGSTQSTTDRNRSIRITPLILRIGESLTVPWDFMVYADEVNDHGVFDHLSWPPVPTG